MRKIFIPLYLFVTFQSVLFAQISNEQAYKFNRVMDLISMFYVDTIKENKLVEKAIITVLKDLDPHSIYLNKDEAREFNEPLIGSFDGIGITYNILRDTVYIISTFHGGPSERMGIKAGDRIICIDDKTVAGIGIKNEQVKDYLLGNKGTNVSLKIKSKGKDDLAYYSIPREQIPLTSIDASYQVNQTTGYIRLNKFSANSNEEFTNSARKLKKSGVENMILDLRDNGGGYLQAATELADHFLPDNKLIVYTMGMNSPKTEYLSKTKGLFEKGKLIVLINENTASASEIVCGAIQDWDKGLIIGRRSFGKGLVQRQFTLTDGSQIRLTVARYYTPSGRLIQKPYTDGYEKYSADMKQRLVHGEFFSADSIVFADSLKYYTLLNKRIVYGGGGIIPDIFVPLDTSLYPGYYKRMMKSGNLYEFILDYVDKNRSQINYAYPDFESFRNKFQIKDDFIKQLIQYSLKDKNQAKAEENDLLAVLNDNSFKINNDDSDMGFDNPNIKSHLKALVAQNLFGIGEYYQILNSADKVFLTAVELLNNDVGYKALLK